MVTTLQNKLKEKALNSLPLMGPSIALREITFADSETIINWRNDSILGKFITREKLTLEQQQAFFHAYKKKTNDFYFVAEYKETKVPIGTIAIYDIDPIQMRGEIGRLVVAPSARLFTVEICSLLFAFCFEVLLLESVFAQAQSANKPSWSFLQKLGFKVEQRLSGVWWNGDDVLRLVIHRDEYFSTLRDRWKSLIPEPRQA